MNATLSRRNFLGRTSSALALTMAFGASSQEPKKKRALKKAIMFPTLGIKGTVLEKFKALKAAGFDGVEPMSHMDQDEVMKAFDETGLKAASVCCATHWSKPLSDPNPAAREVGLEGLRQALRDAKRYGATSVLLVPGVARNGVTYDECFERSVAEVRKVIPLTEELGVKIAVENVWNDFIIKPEQAVEFMDAIGSPMVGWHFDIGNIIRYSPPETWIPKLGKRILKLHIKEFGKDKQKQFNVKFFEGDNNWPAIMKALDDVGYTGWGISEQPGGQTKDPESLAEFSQAMDKVFAS
jgi:L-ribulose-5-phosphate 3-epimerase